MVRIIVERRFEPPVTETDLQAVIDRMAPCFELHKVTWRRSFLSHDRRRMFCEYDAPDVESVRDLQRQAEAPFEQAWAAEVFEAT